MLLQARNQIAESKIEYHLMRKAVARSKLLSEEQIANSFVKKMFLPLLKRSSREIWNIKSAQNIYVLDLLKDEHFKDYIELLPCIDDNPFEFQYEVLNLGD